MIGLETISIGGAAYRTSYIRSYKTCEEWVEDQMTGCAFIDKMPPVRRELFTQLWNLAHPEQEPAKPIRKIKK